LKDPQRFSACALREHKSIDGWMTTSIIDVHSNWYISAQNHLHLSTTLFR
jgi:hypothetical protein